MLFRHRKRKEMEMQQDSHEDLSCMSCYGNHSSCGCDRCGTRGCPGPVGQTGATGPAGAAGATGPAGIVTPAAAVGNATSVDDIVEDFNALLANLRDAGLLER